MKRLVILNPWLLTLTVLLLLPAAATAFGEPPRIGLNGNRIVMDCSKKPYPDLNTRVKIRISGAGHTRRILGQMSPNCRRAWFTPDAVWTPRWDADQWYSTDSLWLQTKVWRRALRMKVVATHQGRTLLSVRFRMKWWRSRGRTIWSGTDAFWNYCVSRDRPVRSRGGRLYCRTPNNSFLWTGKHRYRVGGPLVG